MLTHLVFASLFAFGAYEVVGRGTITTALRNVVEPISWLHELITCAQCSGFWYGGAYALGLAWAAHGELSRIDVVQLVALPVITSGCALVGNDLLDLINTLREKNNAAT